MDDDDAWSGLDDLGSGVSNVANTILSAAGGYVAATINAKTQQTTDQTYVAATNALPLNNPNAWQHLLLIGGILVAVGLVAYEVMKKA